MRRVRVGPGLTAFRATARALLGAEIPPEAIEWSDAADPQVSLLGPPDPLPEPAAARTVPAAFLRVAEDAACFRGAERLPRLYRLLWRLTHGERGALQDPLDDDARAVRAMARAVERDVERMQAFLRFSRATTADHYVAWYAPDHPILERAIPFFTDRFGSMRWTILTPDASVSWDGAQIVWGPPAPASEAPSPDRLEALWRTYWGAIFDPARTDVAAMRDKIPARFAARMPELRDAAQVVAAAPRRVQRMIADATSASRPLVPASPDLGAVRAAAVGCTACPLHEAATQTVFGVGPADARLMLIGEQPGDREDLSGEPFVGPAGAVLDAALERAGIERSKAYLTNAVKHFKYRLDARTEPRRRLHERPSFDEIRACHGWLEAEITRVRPKVIVLLGVTAGQALFGRGFKLNKARGGPLASDRAEVVLATYHPSAILRMGGAEGEAARQALEEDLRAARAFLER